MLSIEPLKHDDLTATASLHMANLNMGLFPKLGRRFLSLYQEGFARSPYGIALVARDDDEVIGALFGTTSNADHYNWVTHHQGIELALAGSGALVTNPQLAFDFARTRAVRYAKGLARHLGVSTPSVIAPRNGGGPLSVLSHIVTAGAARRRGVGRRLVDEFKSRASARGAHRAILVTQEGGLGTPFFERLGCRLVAKRQGQDGMTVREYRMILDEAGAYEDLENNRGRSIVVHAYPPRLGTPRPVPAQRR